MSQENDKMDPEQDKEFQEFLQRLKLLQKELLDVVERTKAIKTIESIKRTYLGLEHSVVGLPSESPITPRIRKKLDEITDQFTKLVNKRRKYRAYTGFIKLYQAYLDLLTEIIPSKEPYIRASEPLLRQTIGQPRKKNQLTLFDQITSDDPALHQDLAESNIFSIGAELSVQGRYALQAIQTEFTKAGYKGPIKLTIPEYLDTYGVKKKDRGRGYLEYHPEERKQALEALDELNKPRFWYVRVLDKVKTEKAKGKKYYFVMKGKEPIVKIDKGYCGVDEAESKQLMMGQERNDKLTHLRLTPSEIFSYRHFILIPEHIFGTVRRLYKKPSKHLLTFIDILILSASHENYKIKRYYTTLADQLHLTRLIATRQKKRLQSCLEEDFARAKELGLLTDYTLGKDIWGQQYVELTLNPEAFYHKKRAVKTLLPLQSGDEKVSIGGDANL